MIFRCFDLETDSTDPATCVVVQAAIVEAPASAMGIDLAAASARSMLFYAASIPMGAQRVHKITPEMVVDAPPFSRAVRSIVQQLTEPGVVAVSYNGRKYDVPIIARYAAAVLGADFVTAAEREAAAVDAQAIEQQLFTRHIDVLRLWLRVRKLAIRKPEVRCIQCKHYWGRRALCSHPTQDGPGRPWPVPATCAPPWCPGAERLPLEQQEEILLQAFPTLTSDMFAGTLTAAYAFYFGRGFDDAHDAAVDCRSTLAVLDAMLRNGDVPDVETAIRWSNEPLPGDVDIDGKFAWDGDRCVITFGKYKGSPIEQVERGFLTWMLRQDFAADTKAVVRKFLSGEYPQRA